MLFAKIRQLPIRNSHQVVALLVTIIALYTAVFSWQSWLDEKSRHINDMTIMAEMGEKAIDNYFRQIEIDVKVLVLNWTDKGIEINQESAYLDAKRFKQFRTEMLNLAVIRPDGKFLFTAVNPPSPNLPSLAKEASWQSYISQAKNLPDFTVGRPHWGKVVNSWLLPSRMAVKNNKGEIVFVISASINADFLQAFWPDHPITEHSTLSLLRDDGYLLSHFPKSDARLEADVYSKRKDDGLTKYLSKNNFPRHGAFEDQEGAATLIVFRRLSHFPLTLVVATPLQDVLEDWWNEVKMSYFLLTMLLSGAILNYFLSLRRSHLKRVEQERIDVLKSEFISVVSHELRTPITSVRGSLGLLEAGLAGQLPESALKLVRIAHKNSLRLSNLVDDILDLEKLMLGKMPLNIQRINLYELVQQAIEANLGFAQTLEVRFVLEKYEKECHVSADGERLTQVLTNLLSNAAKFSPAGAQVYIRIAEHDEAHFRVEVQDFGKGIDSAFQAQIFQAFSQADSTNTRQQGSTGLGLAICKSLIAKMDGEIGFRSVVGQGSTFWFALKKL